MAVFRSSCNTFAALVSGSFLLQLMTKDAELPIKTDCRWQKGQVKCSLKGHEGNKAGMQRTT
jgi:hypothetical protein